MRVVAALAGVVFIFVILWDAFETIVLPRRVTRRFRLTRIFYHYTWLPLSKILNAVTAEGRAETLLSFYGPISLLLLLIIWAGGLIAGFGLLQYAAQSVVRTVQDTAPVTSIWTYVYLSGTTFFTIGLGDIAPLGLTARALVVVEGGMGLGFLALIIGYIPAMNQSFSRREANITVLDAHAGSPPTAAEIIRRNTAEGESTELLRLLSEWERWSAELLDTHLSYPFLAYFRSQHDNQSWLAALTAILDTSALIAAYGVEGTCARQAWMTFAMARHTTVDLAIIFGISPARQPGDRLPPPDEEKMKDLLIASGFRLRDARDAQKRLRELRLMYEPYILSLAGYFCLDHPRWIAEEGGTDNWESSAWERGRGRKGPHRRRHF